MPFRVKQSPLRLDHIEPGDDFDALMDLVEINCEGYVLYANATSSDYWQVDGALMPSSILRDFRDIISKPEIGAPIRIDEANVGDVMYLSPSPYSVRGLWRSRHVVTRLSAVSRGVGLRSSDDFPIATNH